MPLFYCMFEEDLSVFFDPDATGDQLIHQRLGRIFNGVLDRDYIESNDISGFAPVITCATADSEGFERGDVIERGAERYRYIYAEPDGTGVSRLILESV